MIGETINRSWKAILARTGDARVFGEQSDVRRRMSDEEAIEHFATVWETKLEPEVRHAPLISAAEASELLEGRQREYAVEGYQFRQFSLHSVVCVVRLNKDAKEDGVCDQLWSLGAHRDNTRLCMYFETVADRDRFEEISRNLGWEPRNLALSLATDFMRKLACDPPHNIRHPLTKRRT